MSNSSSLEQFIQNNRQAFDAATPGPHCWSEVEKVLDRLPASDPLEQFLALNRIRFDQETAPEGVWQGIAQALDHPESPAGNSLETFIRNNREAFDTETPAQGIWPAIEQTLPGAQGAKVVHLSWYRTLSRLAAAIALLIAGVSIGIWYARADANNGMAMGELSTEYAELEQYYQRDISTKQQKLATFASYRDQDVHDDLQQMDQALIELREELARVPPGNREQVVRAMIENYKAKMNILERVLEHLEQQQQQNKQQPVPTNSSNHEVEKI